MKNFENNVFISHKVCFDIINSGMSENGIVVYLSLLSLLNRNRFRLALDLYSIADVFTPNIELSKRKIVELKNGIQEVASYGHIEIISNKGNRYVLDMRNLYFDITYNGDKEDENPFDITEINYYSKLNTDVLAEIFKKNKYKKTIFRYLLYYISLRNQNENNINGYECFYFIKSIEEMSKELEISKTTILKYNKILEQNKIIFIYHYSEVKNQKTISNACGMYRDKDKIIKSCETYKRR